MSSAPLLAQSRGPFRGIAAHRSLRITIVKELDASSIHFFQAAVTDEVLRSVTCTFYRAFRNGIGEMHAYFRITLTNAAAIVDYRDSGDGSNGTVPGDERERISLT